MDRRRFVSLACHSGAAALAGPAALPAAHAQDAPGVTARAITIASSAPLSGPLLSFGQDLQQGAGAAIAQVNARGGIHGRSVQLQIVDDAYVPDRTVANVRQIVSQGSALALLSCVGTPNNTAIAPMLEEAGLPHVAPITGATSLRKPLRNVFHVRASYTDEVLRLIERLTGMGLKGLGIAYLDNGYGRELLEVATGALQKRGTPAAVQAAVATDGKNLPQVLQTLAAGKPSAVLLATAGTVSAELVRGIKTQLPGVLMAGVSVTLPGASLPQLGESASGIALTMVVPDPHRGRLQLVRDYQGAMRAAGHGEFSQGSLEAYVNARVLLEGLERAGKDVNQARLRSALAGIRQLDLGGFVVDYGGQPPYVGSRFIDLGVLGGSGRFIG
ncbi:ABC transporter substrate-binding protein [Melaminivora suipulveris]|uniref:ABC transporter substrate-binding protein n=1 Tax=Melaminivora suipulveris TaxID=2109913 RepID=A0A2R3QCH3_9BURK|nr:ABC transporter substrate-binding protein [Melaminivora suipulveris]AVO49483.1 ABC transporter substrate-binding protein [Melaminivora suipulveris]